MSLRLVMQGDKEAAAAFIYTAQQLLGRLKTEMSFNNLPQLARTYNLESGEIIRVQSFFGQDTITIEAPFVEPVLVEEEVVELPFILRLRFFGKDNQWHNVFWDVDNDALLELTDITTGEALPQPVSDSDINNKVRNEIVSGGYIRFKDMKMDEHAPSVDWSETSGGVSSLKTIRLFNFLVEDPWLGGYKTTLEFSSNPGSGVEVVIDGRTYFLGVVWVVEDYWGTKTWYARARSYDNDLNGSEEGLRDIHTKDLYTSTGHGFVDIDYYVSHGKVVYTLPNLSEDVRGFCATKTVDLNLHNEEGGSEHASGRVEGHLTSPFISEPELFYDESFDVRESYDPDRPLQLYPEDILREIPNFWIDNISSAFTYKGKAIIFEQTLIEKLYEWNGSPFKLAEPFYDLKSKPTYDLAGRIWIQKDVKKAEEGSGETSYDYQWDNFKEINFSTILEMVKSHPEHTEQRRLFGALLV